MQAGGVPIIIHEHSTEVCIVQSQGKKGQQNTIEISGEPDEEISNCFISTQQKRFQLQDLSE